MEAWKKAVVAGAMGGAAVLLLKKRWPAGVLTAGVGLAVLASEYPEKFENLQDSLPHYFERGMRRPHDVHVRRPDSRQLLHAGAYLIADLHVCRAALCRERHVHRDILFLVRRGSKPHFVNQSQIHDVDWNFRVITLL
jgi:hypothetical protein